jgi:fluoride ion exporter CrcB/FEX
MSDLPTYVYPFSFAVIAALAGWLLAGRVRDEPGAFPGWILYAVAIGCVVIGFATLWLSKNA